MNRQYAVRVVIGLGAGLTALVAAELIIAIAVALAERSSSFLVALYLIFDPRQPHRHFVALGAGCLGAVVAFLLILPSGRRDWPIAALRSGALSTLIAGATLVGAAIGWLLTAPDVSAQVAAVRLWLTDHRPPEISIALPPSPVRGDALITIATRDEGEAIITAVSVDGYALPPSALINLDTASLPDGNHVIVVHAQDTSRQRNQATAQATFRSETHWWLTDSTPPTITLTVPTAVVTGMITLTLTTADEGEYRVTRFTLDDLPLPVTSLITVDTAVLPDGEHTVVVEAEDDSRQHNRAQARAVFRSDNHPPSLSVRFDPPVATQGHVQTIYVTVDEPTSVLTATLSGRPLVLARGRDNYWAVVGFDATATPGPAMLAVRAQDVVGNATLITATQVMTSFAFPIENVIGESVDIPPDRAYLLDPALGAAETAYLDRVFAPVTPDPLWQGVFAMPVQGRQTSPFAIRRSYNGGPLGSYHGGMDIAVDAGTTVLAANRGRVVLAEPLKVRGNAVIIDHGMGVYSCYYHLSEIRVQKGQMVEKGQVVGLAGSTGLSTGPHLHWELRVTGKAVDPAQWIQRPIP